MKKEYDIDFEAIQEEHLDEMIRLAFRYENALIARYLMEDSDPLTPEEEETVDRAIEKAFANVRAQEIRERRHERAKRWRRRVQRIAGIAAIIVLAAALTTPLAVANVEFIRERLIQFLVNINEAAQEQSINFSGGEHANIPDEWNGDYFPEYLPEGVKVLWQGTEVHDTIEFYTEAGIRIRFTENDTNRLAILGTKDGVESTGVINGNEASIVEYVIKGHCVDIVWSMNEQWFYLETAGLETSEALLIANSVRKIEKN